MRLFFGLVLVASAVACSDGGTPRTESDAAVRDVGNPDTLAVDSGGRSDATDGGGSLDAGPFATCEENGPPIGVVVAAANRGSGTPGEGLTFVVNGSGRLTQVGESVEVSLPQSVAVRADGREALIAWGGVSGETGVLVLDIDPFAGTASVSKEITLAERFTSSSAQYITNDVAVLTRTGPGENHLLVLRRNGDALTAEAPLPLPTEGIAWAARPLRAASPRALVLISDLSSPDTSPTVRLLDASSGSGTFGAPVNIGLPGISRMYLHPSGMRAYFPTSNPEDMGENPSGNLHLGIGPDWDLAPVPFRIPRRSNVAAFSLAGDQLFFGQRVSDTESGIFTVNVDGIGDPTSASATLLSFPGSGVESLVVMDRGYVIANRTAISLPGVSNALLVLAETDESWESICDPIEISGLGINMGASGAL